MTNPSPNSLDQIKIDAFWQARTLIDDARLATNYRDDGRLDMDEALVRQYLRPGDAVLDLGAGTCTLSSRLLDTVSELVAVEKFAGFLAKAPDHPNLRKVCHDVATYEATSRFDLILLFGVVNFLTPAAEALLYKRCARMLSPGGTFIVKNQCGVDSEVLVDRHSEELGAHYHARYPHMQAQRTALEADFVVNTVDVYPASINRWRDTHFYAFVCQPRGCAR